MIQKLNARSGSSAVASARPGPSSAAENNEQSWGSWSGNKYYTLEVVQHPLRARMCGFGDKDRRPLAPAAVAKMTVRHDNNEIAEIGDIDVAFFVVTVDLWSADGKHEMNLVLHPSSADRYIPTNVAKPRRRATAPSTPSQRGPESQSSQSSFTALPNPATTYAQHTQHSQYSYPGTSQSTPGSSTDASSQPPPPASSSFSTQQYSESVGWAYPPAHSGHPSHPPPPPHQSSLPSIHTFHQRTQSPTTSAPPSATGSVPSSSGWHNTHSQDSGTSESHHAATNTSPYRAWAPPSADQHHPPPPYVEQGGSSSNMQGGAAPPTATQPSGDGFVPSRYPPPPETSSYPPPPPPDGAPVYAQAPYPQAPPPPHAYPHYGHPQQQHYGPPHAPPTPSHQHTQPTYAAPPSPSPPAPPSLPPAPRHTYTRTLVGPLSANACRLNDEHRKPGIFFLFQDLSIRTEGTFRLRMRLMNVGAPPAPEPGATRVMVGQSPILAQTFTEPFIVYSAKRFPGVPDTTALSIAFGNQGQKLPLRNRHGSRNSGRRRRRGDSDGSEDESDGGR
ncbi:hypothetical protein SCHPADRAFT_911105 [Schizopora paradoxa]|uniref:Velvet domain-containing protein n=1 Tax=Schizopora paradoxa TaxID=27342 RepID=A0A0H2RKK7_9AGAM|nr:hypothetical protein SCHPADRAFT_911105 [Schizopora paradoxa]